MVGSLSIELRTHSLRGRTLAKLSYEPVLVARPRVALGPKAYETLILLLKYLAVKWNPQYESNIHRSVS